jgi:ketosteroid isomerase-like protein
MAWSSSFEGQDELAAEELASRRPASRWTSWHGDLNQVEIAASPALAWPNPTAPFEITGGTFKADLHDVTANDEHATALHVARGQSQGKTLEDKNVVAFHVRDGKIVEAWHYFEDQYVNDDFWV